MVKWLFAACNRMRMPSLIMRPVVFLICLLCGYALHAAVHIPLLNWQPRSDWINVKTDVTPAAKGDGIADDTAAIQAALNLLGADAGQKKIVYLPPGNYKISNTLTSIDKGCIALIGHGRDTRLFWSGPANGTMFWDNGNRGIRFIGIVWDGMQRAAVGVDHSSRDVFTPVRPASRRGISRLSHLWH